MKRIFSKNRTEYNSVKRILMFFPVSIIVHGIIFFFIMVLPHTYIKNSPEIRNNINKKNPSNINKIKDFSAKNKNRYKNKTTEKHQKVTRKTDKQYIDSNNNSVNNITNFKNIGSFFSFLNLLKSDNFKVREKAISEIKKKNSIEILKFLHKALKHNDPVIRAKIAQILAEKKDYRSVTYLKSALKDNYYKVREFSAKALGEIGAPDSVNSLSEALEDKNDFVVAEAAKALAKIGNRRAISKLKNNINQIQSEKVKDKIRKALQEYNLNIPFTPTNNNNIIKDLIMISKNRIIKYNYNLKEKRYKKVSLNTLKKIDNISYFKQAIIIKSNNKIIKLDKNLNKIIELNFDKVDKIFKNNKSIFITTKNSVLVFDRDLFLKAKFSRNDSSTLNLKKTFEIILKYVFPINTTKIRKDGEYFYLLVDNKMIIQDITNNKIVLSQDFNYFINNFLILN